MGLELRDVYKKFITKTKETIVFENISLTVDNGEFICLIGPSGCGKSTLLNIIAGLELPTGGECKLNGKPINTPGPDRMMMFQDSALFPWLKVIDNVEFGLKLAGVEKARRKEIALEFLKKTHLTKFQNSYIHELSGGMRQRVALARCLSMNSDMLLMDEPFAALDSQTRLILQMELQKIWIETQKTIVFVTHSVEEAVLLADRIVLMSANPGGIKEIFKINIKRPRAVESLEVMETMSEVLKSLREEVEKVAKAEFDTEWHLE